MLHTKIQQHQASQSFFDDIQNPAQFINDKVMYKLIIICGYLNQLNHNNYNQYHSSYIPKDIMLSICVWLIDRTKQLSINIHEIYFYKEHDMHKFRLSLNKSIAWFMNIYFQIRCVPNLGPSDCESFADSDPSLIPNHEDIKIFNFSHSISDCFNKINECALNDKQFIYQILVINPGVYRDNIIVATEWEYYTRFHNLQIKNDDAKTMWLRVCSEDGKQATLTHLYPHLMEIFKTLSSCQRQPGIDRLTSFLQGNGGIWGIYSYIRSNKFERFYSWFISICYILKDLRVIYDHIDDPLVGLFYRKTDALREKVSVMVALC